MEQAAKDVKLSTSAITEIVLEGGFAEISARQVFAKTLVNGKAPNQSVNPDEVVVVGAAA